MRRAEVPRPAVEVDYDLISGRRLVDSTWTVPASAVADESERLRLLVDAVSEYAIFLLAPDGTVLTWNPGAQRLKGYAGHEVVGRHFSVFYPPEDVAAGKPQRELDAALCSGTFLDEGWRVRKDGTRFWAHVNITALFDGPRLRGFAKVTRDDTAARAAVERGKAMQDITRALLDREDLSDVLARIARHARHITGAARTWIATPHGAAFLVRAADGTAAGPQAGMIMPNGPAFRNVMAAGKAIFVDSLPARYPAIPELVGLGAGMIVPLSAGSGMAGVLVAATELDTSTFGSVDLDLLQAFADQAELVLAYARAQMALRDQELGDDRERIARDLHDHVIQQLFATGLSLQGAAMRLRDPELHGRVADAVDRLDGVIRQIRTTIFDLHEKEPDADGTRARMGALVHDATRALNFQPALAFQGPIDTGTDPVAGEHLFAALREMLSNVARHAGASAASVSVSVGEQVVLCVTDNGTGPPVDLVSGSGLRNLRARASALGGAFTLEPGQHHGTVATFAIPGLSVQD